jgi:hypothetical protein
VSLQISALVRCAYTALPFRQVALSERLIRIPMTFEPGYLFVLHGTKSLMSGDCDWPKQVCDRVRRVNAPSIV